MRTRAVVRGLAYLDIGVAYDCYIYVRPDEIDTKRPGFELPNDGHRLVVTLRDAELLYFLVLTNPSMLNLDSPELKALHATFLDTMAWQMAHMPELIRKSPIHVGMPGVFHALSTHLSQHSGAHGEIELTEARERCRCSQCCSAEAQHAEWRQRRHIARGVVAKHANNLDHLMPTEYARQSSEVDNYLTPYAECRGVLEDAKLGDQDAFCQSAANKASIDHGDGNNHGQFNMLYFSAPEFVQRMLAADPTFDLGIWAMEQGRVFIPLKEFGLIFNSAAGHCVLPHMDLLPYVCDVARLRTKASAYAALRTQAALAAVRADPSLLRMFTEELTAAMFQSSLVGTTTYQQQAVTHQCLRAAAIGRPELLLRASWQPVHTETAVLSPEEARAAKREAEREMAGRLRELQVGMCVRVTWESGEVVIGTVVEPPVVSTERSARVADVGVRLRYEEHGGRVLCERLGCLDWVALRG